MGMTPTTGRPAGATPKIRVSRTRKNQRTIRFSFHLRSHVALPLKAQGKRSAGLQSVSTLDQFCSRALRVPVRILTFWALSCIHPCRHLKRSFAGAMKACAVDQTLNPVVAALKPSKTMALTDLAQAMKEDGIDVCPLFSFLACILNLCSPIAAGTLTSGCLLGCYLER